MGDAAGNIRGTVKATARALRALTPPNSSKVVCPHCDKRVKKRGLGDHLRDVHSEAAR